MLRTAYSLSPTPELRAKFDAEYFKNLLQFVLEKVTSPQLCIDRISRVIKDMRTIFGCELDNECVKYIIGGYLHWGRFGEVESVMHTIVDTFPIESRELALTAILKVYNAMYNTFGIEKVLSELYYLNGLKVRKYIPVRRSKLFPALLKVLDKRPSVHEVRWNLEMKTIEVMLESYTLLQQPENALYLIDLAHRCKAITVKVYRNALETLFQLAQRKTKDHQHKHIFAYARDLFTATMKRYQTDANVFQLMYKLETMCNRMDFSKRKIAFRKRKYLKFNPEYMSNLLHRRLKFGEYKKAKLLFYRYYYLKIRPNRKSRKYWLHKKDALDISKVYSNYNYSLSIYPRTDDAYRAFRKCRSLQAKTIVPTLRRLSHVHKSYRKAKDYGIGPTSEDFQILFFNMLSSKAFEDWYRAKRIYRMMVKRFDPPIWMMRAYARLLEESGESGGEIERLYRAADRKSRNSIFSQVYISPFNKTWFE
ncbi:hypothetical protein HK098_005027 [Nowakowskiella sp. JEL0407]|nr:hypothetical protein HK098_005027 [Nowakowskiella sp. JEL0407]